MKTKLDKVLIVDDSEADTFIHVRQLKKAGIVNNITTKRNGREALDYLCTPEAGRYPAPELVFLDINMPVMNGWEFLDAYQSLPDEQRANIVVTMLTTSASNRDRDKAAGYGILINDYEEKPLTVEKIHRITQRHFPERF